MMLYSSAAVTAVEHAWIFTHPIEQVIQGPGTMVLTKETCRLFGLLLWAIIEAPGRTWGASPIVPGLLLIALGLGFLSQTTISDGYRWCVPFFLLIGCGVGLALAPSTDSVMGSIPKDEAGVGSATSDTSMQVGGALGVAVLGTALNIRYQHLMSALIGHRAVPDGQQLLDDVATPTDL